MIDSVLKGTGNSRFLKSAVPAGTSWADALAMLQAGTFPIDFNGINTEGFQQVGTPLNKANLLKDATAAQIGLPPSTTPDGMFQALGNTGELHVWRKTVTTAQEIPAGYTLGSVKGVQLCDVYDGNSNSYVTFQYGPSISVDDNGNVSLASVSGTLTAVRYNMTESKYTPMRGKFVQATASGSSAAFSGILFIASDAAFTVGTGCDVDKCQEVTGYPLTPARTTTTYPVSTNPKAYQEGDDAKAAGYVLGDAKRIVFYSGNDRLGFKYGDAITVSDDGKTIDIKNPSYQEWYGSNINNVTVMSGKFIRFTFYNNTDYETSNPVYFMPSTSKMEYDSNYNVSAVVQPVTGYAAIPAGTTIEYLGKLGDKARVQVLSYVGTGTYGSSNPNSLTFDFVPKVVIFLVGYYVSGNSVLCYLDSEYYRDSRVVVMSAVKVDKYTPVGFGLSLQAWAKKTPDGKTIFWYNTSNQEVQANISGVRYHFLALG